MTDAELQEEWAGLVQFGPGYGSDGKLAKWSIELPKVVQRAQLARRNDLSDYGEALKPRQS